MMPLYAKEIFSWQVTAFHTSPATVQVKIVVQKIQGGCDRFVGDIHHMVVDLRSLGCIPIAH